jgi:hypothetical protein
VAIDWGTAKLLPNGGPRFGRGPVDGTRKPAAPAGTRSPAALDCGVLESRGGGGMNAVGGCIVPAEGDLKDGGF